MSDELDEALDEAIAALRDEPLEEDEGTLARILASVADERAQAGEDLLEDALDALRSEGIDGPPAHATVAETERRIASSLSRGARDRRRLWLAAAAAMLLAALGAPTAWAWASGELARWLEDDAPTEVSAPVGRPVAPGPREPAPPSIVEPVEPSAPPPAPPPAPPIDSQANGTSRAPARDEPVEARPTNDRASLDQTSPDRPALDRPALAPLAEADAPAPPDVPVPADRETLAFREAHRAHFEARDYAAALAAWDRYLAQHPGGRYQPEARYNRALALVHLGRLSEARAVLARFADAEPGAYRQAEAEALVDALDERITPPAR